ncbi:MAG: hypothetical protein KDB18_11205, partial [Salinibacterium sp.]|nr:hypothetical protein [Salinibacterium sp.]
MVDGMLGVTDKRVVAIKERYSKVRDAQERWNSTAMDNRRLWAGAHYTSEQLAVLEERGQPPIAIQITYQIVEQAIAMLTARRPSTRALPREDSDPKLARVWSDLFAWHWEQSDGAGEMKMAFRDHYTTGRGVILEYMDWDADDGRGEVKFMALDPTEVYPDPASKDPLWRDAKDVFVARWMTEDKVKSLWPKKWKQIEAKGTPSEIEVNGSSVRQEHNGEYVWEGELPERDYDRKMYLVLERFEKR